MATDFLGRELKEGDIVVVPLAPSAPQSHLWLGVVCWCFNDEVVFKIHTPDEDAYEKIWKGKDLVKTDILDDPTHLVNLNDSESNVAHTAQLKLKGVI